ncbi:MAG: hypothetical protein MUE50_03925 [Pirellulaceae bacterium]|jgi:hypothetical protein|nr:hypothetical protein [Pirellulaceae bacterium]
MTTAYQPIVPAQSLSAQFWTYQDAVEWLLDFYGRNARSARDVRLARRAVDNAYRDLVANERWSWYESAFTLLTDANYNTGTVAYSNSARVLTLTGGTWPANAAYGIVRVNDVTCKVQARLGDTTVRLMPDENPGADIAAGESYEWYRDTYYLPLDFQKLSDPIDEASAWGIPGLLYVPPDELYRYNRWSGTLQTEPTAYTIMRDQRTSGYAIVMANPPSTARNYSFQYVRAPRPLRVQEYCDGTIDVTADSAAVGGNSTTWLSEHVGCVLRVSKNSKDKPTSPYGNLDGTDNPAWATRLVAARTDGASLTADVAFDETKEGVRYTLSDPLDIDWQTCGNYFQRLMELHYAIASNDHLQRGYKLPQAENERRKARAMDAMRTLEIQPPPWAGGMPTFLFADVTTETE